MVSAFFFARTLDKNKVFKDSVFFVTMFLDEQLYKLHCAHYHIKAPHFLRLYTDFIKSR